MTMFGYNVLGFGSGSIGYGVEILLVAGGGGGASYIGSGGGGAGGYIHATPKTVIPADEFTITIGAVGQVVRITLHK